MCNALLPYILFPILYVIIYTCPIVYTLRYRSVPYYKQSSKYDKEKNSFLFFRFDKVYRIGLSFYLGITYTPFLDTSMVVRAITDRWSDVTTFSCTNGFDVLYSMWGSFHYAHETRMVIVICSIPNVFTIFKAVRIITQ